MLWELWRTIIRLERKVDHMAADFSKLEAAVARLIVDVDALVAQLPDPSEGAHVQAQIDALADALNAESTKVEGPVPPVEPTV